MSWIIDFLMSWGYWGMLVSAFLAGSFFPFSSEVVMSGLQAAGLEPIQLVLVWKHRQCARFYVQLWRRTDGQAGMDREISACKERES